MWRPAFAIGCLLLASAAPLASAQPGSEKGSAESLVPLRTLFAATNVARGFRISPDGKHIAWISSYAQRPTIHFRSFDGGATERIAWDKPVYAITWAADSQHLLFAVDPGGAENGHIYSADIADPSKAPVDRTPFEGVRNVILRVLHDDPDHVLIISNRRLRSANDVASLNIQTGEITTIAEDPGHVLSWIIDASGAVIGRVRLQNEHDRVLEAADGSPPGKSWRLVRSLQYDEDFVPEGVATDAHHVWGLSNIGRDKLALVQLDLTTGGETVAFARDDVDLSGVLMNWGGDQPLCTAAWPDYQERHCFDSSLATELGELAKNDRATISVVSMDREQAHLVVAIESDRVGTTFCLLERSQHRCDPLGGEQLDHYKNDLAATQPIAFRARDGLPLHGYLTLPAQISGRPLPMVLLVHGGPWARDTLSYDPMVQMLANRGYGVLRINFRGSLGYGRAFARLADHQFARAMQDDLVDGVRWAIAQGHADPARIAIMGESYGGYATLVGLTSTPDLFAAGIDIFGAADLTDLLTSFPEYWHLERWHNYVGNPALLADRADMAARSPINHLDRIRAPLLVVQGGNDVRVLRDQSDRLVEALRARGDKVDYLFFPDEGHGIRKWQDRLLMAQRIETFLAAALGGRAEHTQ